MTGLKSEIEQETPFRSAEEEAMLNLLRTSDYLGRALQKKIRPWGITSTQYNVLRILRGAGRVGYLLGHRPADDYRRTGYYAAARPPEGPQVHSPAA